MFLVIPAVHWLFLQVTGCRRCRCRTLFGQDGHFLFIASRLDKFLELDAAVDALPDSRLFGLPRFHLSPITVVEAMAQLNSVFAARLLLHHDILSFNHLVVFILTFATAGEQRSSLSLHEAMVAFQEIITRSKSLFTIATILLVRCLGRCGRGHWVHLLLPVSCDLRLTDAGLWLPVCVTYDYLTIDVFAHFLYLEFNATAAPFPAPMCADD